MSNFEVKIQPIFITPHSNANALELGNIGSPDGWQVIVAKGKFQTGNMVAYIGENAVVPEWVLKKYGYWNEEQNKGILAGSKGDRVKAIRLRGEFSLGIVIPVREITTYDEDEGTCLMSYMLEDEYVEPDENVADLLGVTKYEPPIPVEMAGEVYNFGTHVGVNYDIENIKNYPDVLVEGEEVQITEKLHGTFCQIVVMPYTQQYQHEDHFIGIDPDGNKAAYIAISSKGLGGKGLFLKNNEKNANNIYVRTAQRYFDTLVEHPIDEVMTLCGEVFGHGVQDLHYGYSQGQTDFRLFDVYFGRRGAGEWLNDEDLDLFVEQYGIERVPLLYRGPYSKQLIQEMTQKTKSVFDPKQIREGVVIKPVEERNVPNLGRVALKSINESYLTRKNGTEFN